MGANTKIEWTTHTFNPWRGCSKVHAGCANCYAETMFAKRLHDVEWGPNGTRKVASEAAWREPVKWNADAEKRGVRERVFCASLADVFEGPESMPASEWPKIEAARSRLFRLIDATPYLDWLLLTKRPENIFKQWTWLSGSSVSRENVWLGVSVSDQATADKLISELLKCRSLCAGLFVSAEPMLGPVDLRRVPGLNRVGSDPGINWLIVGGESGPNARPMHPDWARSLRDQCQAAGVPFFFKQWGEWGVGDREHEFVTPRRVGKKKAGAMLDGREWRETPFAREGRE